MTTPFIRRGIWRSQWPTLAAGTAAAPSLTFTGDTNTGIFSPAADTIAFAEGGVESMRLDSSGNLGLGVTPSAWAAALKALQVGTKTSINFGATTGALSYNSFFDTGFKYLTTDFALDYRQNSGNGSHAWFTAPSGTAGTAITFTQAMTLDASENLGVGTASPSFTAGTGVHLYRASGAAVRIQDASTDFDILSFNGTVSLSNRSTGPVTVVSNNVERMRVKATGQIRLVPLAAAPGGEEDGDLYYNSATNKLQLRAGGAWVDLN
jgi:hypothetical protein